MTFLVDDLNDVIVHQNDQKYGVSAYGGSKCNCFQVDEIEEEQGEEEVLEGDEISSDETVKKREITHLFELPCPYVLFSQGFVN